MYPPCTLQENNWEQPILLSRILQQWRFIKLSGVWSKAQSNSPPHSFLWYYSLCKSETVCIQDQGRRQLPKSVCVCVGGGGGGGANSTITCCRRQCIEARSADQSMRYTQNVFTFSYSGWAPVAPSWFVLQVSSNTIPGSMLQRDIELATIHWCAFRLVPACCFFFFWGGGGGGGGGLSFWKWPWYRD